MTAEDDRARYVAALGAAAYAAETARNVWRSAAAAAAAVDEAYSQARAPSFWGERRVGAAQQACEIWHRTAKAADDTASLLLRYANALAPPSPALDAGGPSESEKDAITQR